MKVVYIFLRDFVVSIKNSKEFWLEKLIRLCLYVGIFFLPMFFIPISVNFLEFSKVLLFYLFVLVSVILWLIKIFWAKRINLQWHYLDIPVLVVFFINLLSGWLGVNRYQSFIGYDLLVSSSCLTLGALVLFYFLVSRFVQNYQQVKTSFYLINVSIFIILLVKLSQFVFNQLLFLNFGLTINTFSFLLVLGLVLSGVLMLLADKKAHQLVNWLFLLGFLTTLFLIDNQYVLLIFSLIIFIFILLLSLKSSYLSNKLIVGITLLLFLTIIVLIMPVSKFTGIISPKEFNLPLDFGRQITQASLSDNLMLGVGPQNFSFSFYKYKPLAYNQTNYWQLGFERNSNFWLETLNNLGIIGLFFMIVLVGKYFLGIFKFLKQPVVNSDNYYQKLLINCGLGVVLFFFVAWGFYDHFNFIQLLYFFFFMGLVPVNFNGWQKNEHFTNKNFINLGFYLAFILLISAVYLVGKLFAGEIYLEKNKTINYTSEADYQLAEQNIELANKNNAYLVKNNLLLANLLINRVNFLAESKQNYDKDAYKEKIVKNLEIALVKDLQDIGYYIRLSQVLDSLKNLTFDTYDAAKVTNEKLISLDPNNPELYIDRALLSFNRYQQIRDGQTVAVNSAEEMASLIDKTMADLEKSLQLKSDYLLAYYNLGLLTEELQDEKSALAYMEKAYSIDPSQKLVVLNLKKLYLNQDKVEKAAEILNKYLELNQQDVEIRLELAKLYRDNQESNKAKLELDKIIVIDPNNETASKMLSEL